MSRETDVPTRVSPGEDFESDLLNTPSPDTRRRLMAQTPGIITETLVASLSARARAASAISPSESLRIAEIADEVALAVGTPRAQAFALWAQGAALRAHSRHEEAVGAFLSGSNLAERAEDPLLAARIPMGATETLAQLGRFEEALCLSRDLEARLNALGSPEDAAKVVANAGNIHFEREAYGDALAHWQRALAFFEERGEALRVARLQMNVGNALTCLHRTTEAVRMYEAARETLEAAGMDLLVAGLDGDLGFLRFLAGQHTESLEAYARARRRFESLDLPKEVAQADRETADVYLDLNLVPEAREMYERVLPVLRGHGLGAESARGESGLAAALFRQEQRAEAFAALDRAEDAFREEGNAVGVARTRLRRAGFLHRQGDSESATAEANAALATFRQHGLTLESLQARLLLAEIRVADGGNPTRTLERLAEEADAFPLLRWRIEAALARAARNAGRRPVALGHYREAIAAVEQARTILAGNEFRIAFLQDKARLYEELMDVLLKEDTTESREEAFAVLEQSKSRTLHEAMTDRADGDGGENPERDALRERLDALRARLNWRYLSAENPDVGAGRLPSGGQDDGTNARTLEREYLEAYRQLEIVSGKRTAISPALQTRAQDIAASLPEGEQIVAFGTIGDEILAFLVDRSGLQVFRELASLREVEKQVERLRFQWRKMEMGAYIPGGQAKSSDVADRILGQLHTALLEPLRPLLTGPRLTVVPHGILHNIPFHAFRDSDVYLADRLEIAYAPSCSVWQTCLLKTSHFQGEHQGNTGSRSLVFGLAADGLAHTGAELASLRELLPDAEVFEGPEATVSAVPESGAFQYLHFATHAVFRRDNPQFSALRLADGWLFAHDLYRRRLDCALATLSACHTGTGLVTAGDEVLGLVHGFLHAGARAVLVSQWAADDAATAALMRAFYSGMAAGKSRAAALRDAQQAVRQVWPHPYYWATFALIGAR